jgi:hypothetical protein
MPKFKCYLCKNKINYVKGGKYDPKILTKKGNICYECSKKSFICYYCHNIYTNDKLAKGYFAVGGWQVCYICGPIVDF